MGIYRDFIWILPIAEDGQGIGNCRVKGLGFINRRILVAPTPNYRGYKAQ